MLKNALWLFAFATLILILFLPSFTLVQDQRQKNKEYARRIEELEAKNSELRREKQLLENDPVYLEKVGREKMGLVREGEMIFRLAPEETQK